MKEKKDNENELGLFEKKQNKHNKIATLFIALSFGLSLVAAFGILPIKESPDILAFETIAREGSKELYQISIFNKGKIGHKLRVELSFPLNTSIDSTFNFGGETQIVNETFGQGKHEYTIIYSEIQENENIVIRLLLKNSDFDNNENLKINPLTVYLWNEEEGKIEIIR